MGKLYNIAFKGEIAEGFEAREVKASFSERFKRGDDVIDQIFSGSPITLAKNLEWEKANTAASNLRNLGALVYVMDDQGNTVEIAERRTANDSILRPIGVRAVGPNRFLLPDPDFTKYVNAVAFSQR